MPVEELNKKPFAALMDGHSGKDCVNYVAQKLPLKLAEILPLYLNKYGDETLALYNALKVAFVEMHEGFIREVGSTGGTTACLALAHNKELWPMQGIQGPYYVWEKKELNLLKMQMPQMKVIIPELKKEAACYLGVGGSETKQILMLLLRPVKLEMSK